MSSHETTYNDLKPSECINSSCIMVRSDSYKESSSTLDLEKQVTVHEGDQKPRRLSWQRMTICMLVEAIALGSLSLPSVFASVGMLAGIAMTVGIGLIAIYTSYVLGQVKVKFDSVEHYADAVRLMWGRFGYELSSIMFVLFLVLLAGSHTLTGTIAFVRIIQPDGVCALVWGVISAVILFFVALPPSFHNFSYLGYIDFVSICLAIMLTIVATGIEASKQSGGLAAVQWSLLPPESMTFHTAFLASTNVVFAYSFAVCQFSFMSELAQPTEYVKSIWTLGVIEITIYTLTGALIYRFVGQDVSSPALLSAGPLMSRIVFAVAIPVIFISGSINSTVTGQYILERAFRNSPIRKINNPRGWLVWLSVIAVITLIGWIVAQAVPFFNDLLGLISALFSSGFTLYFPALFWFKLIKEGKWNNGWRNLCLSILNVLILVLGVATLVMGSYTSIQDIIRQYASGTLRASFSCDASQYA